MYARYSHERHHKEESSQEESDSELSSEEGDPTDADVIADVDYKGDNKGKKHKKLSQKSKKHGRHYRDYYYDDDNYWDFYERKVRGDHYPYYDYDVDHYPYYGSSHHHALWKANQALDHPLKSTYRYRDDWSGYYDDYHHLWRDYPYSDYYGHDDPALNAKIDHAVKKELGDTLG